MSSYKVYDIYDQNLTSFLATISDLSAEIKAVVITRPSWWRFFMLADQSDDEVIKLTISRYNRTEQGSAVVDYERNFQYAHNE